MTASDSLAVWLVEHPRLRRVIGAMTGVYVLCLWAVVAAPKASAAVGAAALGWTGLHDLDNVPIADYFLSMVDTTEATFNNGQHVSAFDPESWGSWIVKATQTAIAHTTAAWWLTNEAALVVFAIGIALWLLRFAMSSSWLLALVQIGRPVFATVNMLVNQMWLGPLAVAVCVVLAGYHQQRGRPAQARNLLGTAAVLAALVWTVFRDPIDDLVSDHGLLGMGRATGFQIAQDARQSSYAPGQSLDTQLDALLAQLVSSTARPALQLQNFGMVVDDVGTCRQAWSQAILAAHSQGPGPAHAMAGCGAPQALAHAQQLGANDFVLGLVFLFAAFWIGLFIWYVGVSTLLVGAKATYYCIVVVPAAMVGMSGWQRGKKYAVRCVSQVLLHGVEMMIFTVFLALSAVGMGWALTTPQLGHGATAVPRLLLVSLGSVVGIFLFHYIDKHFYTDSLGTIAHHITGAWCSTSGAVRDEYNDYAEAGRKARGLFRRVARRGDSDGAGDDDGSNGDADTSTPGFDAVKPRPSRMRGEEETTATRTTGATTTRMAAEKAGASEAAATAGGHAAAAAAEGAGATAAEGAAAAAAPEVVIPAVITEKTVQHIRGHHHRNGSDPGSQQGVPDSDTSPHLAASNALSNGQPGEPDQGEVAPMAGSDGLPSLPSHPRRPAQGVGRHQAPPSATPDEDPGLPLDTSSEQQRSFELSESPVEFPSPPRPRARDYHQ
ncbi:MULTISPECIES: hypothetical protein [Mycobacteriaceae]|uniref:TrbL/VirB6 plasmid conjugal transfer protein n=9 Tax=Mycobacteriaceae TaxID=1762 RepID=D5P1R4_9MYCO|nr:MULTISPECIES: hypothetical protein [Mycobacteriaceae]EFG79975.1 hypothetical protein HMPREF0591_0108 [Mycobacterium parascrofulaceum ATCC BAA-614]PJE04392.1 MAG: hypothetical protein CK429_31460 [Mycobacterium sp.]ASL07567.1 hypothetical protein MYCODSM44623_00800 [Mycobacterium intracellulare subsp. chimaera]ASL13223.1 hypothetical protein MYCOZU2_00769 [Mycobacterium intracellulare subsp. chimaera]ASL19362.1 hypothetical protein MYCOZU1_00899 [Mycobacterium intracellulare subsp. chimaera]